MKIRILIYSLLLSLISCSKNDNNQNTRIINSTITQPEIEINSGDTLKVKLGSFGDEEGTWIYKDPVNAKISRTYREINTSSILYEYFPNDTFTGKDTVVLILNRGSDGASSGSNDTIPICIIVK